MAEEPQKQLFPAVESLRNALEMVLRAELTVSPELRARDPDTGMPGGLIRLPPQKPCVLVPDLHARPDFIDALLRTEFPVLGEPLEAALTRARVSLVFLGDIPHAEGKAASERWLRAYQKLVSAHDGRAILSPEMDEEMGLSLSALLKVTDLLSRFPDSVFCLKGNHDNMTNAADHGDFPFYKYADEGRMGALWLELRYGVATMRLIREYELSLPVIAVGGNYCASHAEPAKPLSKSAVIAYSRYPGIVQSLIWTANGEAEKGALEESLSSMLGSPEKAREAAWFSGHRPVVGHFMLRARGRLVQIHNPELWQVVFIGREQTKADFFTIVPGGGCPEGTTSLILDPSARQK